MLGTTLLGGDILIVDILSPEFLATLSIIASFRFVLEEEGRD
jgi:hypothetical protein